jgi:hypothetical protein
MFYVFTMTRPGATYENWNICETTRWATDKSRVDVNKPLIEKNANVNARNGKYGINARDIIPL